MGTHDTLVQEIPIDLGNVAKGGTRRFMKPQTMVFRLRRFHIPLQMQRKTSGCPTKSQEAQVYDLTCYSRVSHKDN